MRPATISCNDSGGKGAAAIATAPCGRKRSVKAQASQATSAPQAVARVRSTTAAAESTGARVAPTANTKMTAPGPPVSPQRHTASVYSPADSASSSTMDNAPAPA